MAAPLKILVVEDDRVYAEFVVATLRGAGHELAHVETGAAAREQVGAMQPDAVVLDLTLPDESGFDIARALRGGLLSDGSVIILLTASMFPDRDTAEAIGIDIVLSKPVTAELVIGIIDLVHARRQRR
ncbi:MAG TPA: response regulator [Kofleriaceae bacterium]